MLHIMRSAIFLWLSLSMTTLASPKTPKIQAVNVNANFDDIQAGIATALGGTPVPSPYKGLCYAGASVANKTIAVTGVQPQSRPNILGSAPPQRLTNGGVISASVDGCSGTNTKSFSLESFYFGCEVIAAQSAAEVPAACSLTVSGTRAGGLPNVTPQTFNFKPTGALVSQQRSVKLSGFTNLETVTFSLPTVQNVADIILMDNLQYTLYY